MLEDIGRTLEDETRLNKIPVKVTLEKIGFNKLRTIYPEIYQKIIEKENVHKKKQPSTARLTKS